MIKRLLGRELWIPLCTDWTKCFNDNQTDSLGVGEVAIDHEESGI